MVGGDLKTGYRIVDRIGSAIEIIPHLFGAAQGQFPTGQRGRTFIGGWAAALSHRTRSAIEMAAKMLVARTSFACEVKGVDYVISQGQAVANNHPAVKGREQLFEPAKDKAA